MTRPPWPVYWSNQVKDVAARSTCTRHKFGCIIVDESDEIVSSGFNGVIRGASHCLDIGCIKDKLHIASGMGHEICPAVHAEMNALLQAGKKAAGGSLYVNALPCKICARLIVNAKIKNVVISGDYPDEEGVEILRDAKINVVIFDEV